MKHRSILAIILAVTLLLIPAFAAAEEGMSPEALEIANSLNCPVCQGQSVRDSNAQLARQMRDVIQQKVAAGEPRDQIITYFTDRYGVGILREPPKEGLNLALWWVPFGALAVGAVLVVIVVRQRDGAQAGAGATVSGTGDAAEDDGDLRQYEERLLRDVDGLDARAR